MGTVSEDWAMRAALKISRDLVLDIPDDYLERIASIIRDEFDRRDRPPTQRMPWEPS